MRKRLADAIKRAAKSPQTKKVTKAAKGVVDRKLPKLGETIDELGEVAKAVNDSATLARRKADSRKTRFTDNLTNRLDSIGREPEETEER